VKAVRKLTLVVVFCQLIKFEDFHQLQKLFSIHPRIILGQSLPENKTEQLHAVQSVPFLSDFARHHELFNKLKEFLMRVLELVKVGDVIEIAKVGMNHLHHDDRVQRDVHLKGLAIFVTELDEPTQR
jgi:hypothetical protein